MRTLPPLGVLFALAVLAAAGCGDDGGDGGGPVAFPASWAGIWDLDGTITVCGTDSIIDTISEADTICAGEAFAFEVEEGFELDCTGTITDTAADIDCTGSFSLGGVTCNGTVNVSATRNGDVYTAMAVANVTCTGQGEIPPDFCLEQEITAVRTSTAQPGCDGGSSPPWLRLPAGSTWERTTRSPRIEEE